jgi:hypothetical protein
MRRLVFVFPLVFALSFASTAAAGMLWGYENPSNTTALTPGSAAGLTFPNTTRGDGPANGRISATAVQEWSVAPAASPDRVTAEAYTFDLKLTDYTSGRSGVLAFKGVMDGTIWKTGTSLTNTFTGPTSASVNLGGSAYTVTLDGFTAPTGFGEAGAGAITADVSVRAMREPETELAAAHTPEPATGVLGALAVGVLGLARLSATGRRGLAAAVGRDPAGHHSCRMEPDRTPAI